MAQFDVFRVGPARAAIPFVVDIQSDYLEAAESRVVVPLVRVAAYKRRILEPLNPVFTVNDEKVLLLVTQIATMPRGLLKGPVASLAAERSRIVRAIDVLLLGV